MADRRPFQQNFCSMPAFGRQFELGDLYDYRTHSVIKDEKLSWSPAALSLATQVDHTKEFKKSCNGSNDDLFPSSLDNHTRLSITAGLIELNGASSCMYHRRDPGQATVTFSLSINSKERYLDLKTLVDQGLPPLPVPVEIEKEETPSDRGDFFFRLLFSKRRRTRLSPEVEVKEISDATHIVVGVFYGAEAHCVLTQDLTNKEEDEEARDDAVTSMSRMTKKFLAALSNNKLDVTNFKNTLNSTDKHLIARLKCRLYSDLQTELVQDCDFFDAYSRCHNLVDHLKKTDGSKCVPIAIQLCPLKILFASASKYASRMFGDLPSIDDKLLGTSNYVFRNLERIMQKTEKLCVSVNREANRSTLRQFLSHVSAFYELMKSPLKRSIIPTKSNTNRNSTVDWAKAVGAFPRRFHPTQLDKWLMYKQSELDMEERIVSRAGTAVTLLSDTSELEEQVTENSIKKYALVLSVPPLDEKTVWDLAKMKRCIDKGENIFLTRDEGDLFGVESNSSEDEDNEDEVEERPWHITQPAKRKCVLDSVRCFGNYAEKNQLISSQVEFCITFAESRYPFTCHYAVYEDGEFRDGINGLPGPPTGLRISRPTRNANVAKRAKTTFSSICVEWDYESLDYLDGSFLVEYRLKGTLNSWSQLKTTEPDQRKVTIDLEIGSTLEIRVAAETCVGRSDFSQVIDSDSAVEQVYEVDDAFSSCSKVKKNVLPPTGATTTSIAIDQAELKWSPPHGDLCCLRYRVSYWKKSEESSSSKEKETGFDVTTCSLENLESDSTYLFNIVTIADDHCKTMSEPSETGEFLTKKKLIEFATDKFVERCIKIDGENGLDLYSVPRTKVTELLTADRFIIDTNCGMADPANQFNSKHRSILFVGDSDCGKTSLINNMVNYILGVNKEDTFRLQLIDPCPVGSVEKVNVYDIRHAEGVRIPYSVTIIDTPSYVDCGPGENKKTTRKIRKFIDDHNGVHQIDTICFVIDSTNPHLTPSQLYIYCVLMKIFGTDVKNNVEFLLTRCDSEDPPPLLTIITKAGLVPSSGDPRYYKIPTVSSCNDGWISGFFSSLDTTTTKSVSLRKRMPDERSRLESTVNGLEMFLKKNVAEFEELLSVKENLPCETDEGFAVKKAVVEKVYLPFGHFVTNCQKCHTSCHLLCGCRNSKLDCDVMDPSMPAATRTCRVCKCSWEVHTNDSYKWTYEKETRHHWCSTIKEKYEKKLNKTLTSQELLEEVGAEFGTKAKQLVEIFYNALCNIKMWKHISIRLNPPSSRWRESDKNINNIIEIMSDMLRVSEPPEKRIQFDDKEVKANLFELLWIARQMYHDGYDKRNRSSDSDDSTNEEDKEERAEVGDGDA